MNPSSAVKILIAVLLTGFSSFALAEDNLFIFVFKNGVAQKNINVKVGDSSHLTNQFGVAEFDLPGDVYEVGYYQDGELFAITDVNLQDELQSQIFLNLTSDGAEAEMDLPISSYKQAFEQTEVKEQLGPKGTLKLRVVDAESNEPVPGVKLFFKGYAVEGSTDEDGVATVELSQGKYDISLVHPSYVMQVVKEVNIKANTTQEQQAAIVESNIVLDEYVVTAPVVEGSLASSFNEMKDSDVLTDAISSEQFSKSGDSSASGALKRVTGITIVDGKFVFVRGLGERYSTILLNGLHVPSPEPTKRVVPLDIFPTGVIQSLDIQKTYSSNLPGTFAGGTVLINTKDIPKEDNFIKGSAGISYNGSTGDEALYSPDNSKPLPQIVLDLSEGFTDLTDEVKNPINGEILASGLTSDERQRLDAAMVSYRDYALERKKIKPGTNLSATIGQSFKTSSGLKWGLAGALYYKTDEDSETRFVDLYQFNQGSGEIRRIEENKYQLTKLSEKYGGLISFGLETLSNHKFKYTLLMLNENQELTNFGQRDEIEEGRYRERTFLQYTEKTLASHQLNGDHPFGKDKGGFFDDVIFSWGLGLSEATRLEPGTFEYEYRDQTEDILELDEKKLFYLYSDLEDEVDNYRVDLKLPFSFNNQSSYTSFGIYKMDKTRRLDNRRFKVDYGENRDISTIDEVMSVENAATDVLDIKAAYLDDDFYTANQDLEAFHLSQMIAFNEHLNLLFGFRSEESAQVLLVGENEEESRLDTDDVLPFLNLTYKFNAEHQIRAGFSQTLSRPDFREFSTNRYKDPLTGYIVRGFDELKPTEISNYDIKYEFYPSFDEFYSIGLFAKEFIDPIESVRGVADVDVLISFRNAESARSLGLELGFRKRLDNYAPFLKNYFVSGNYAYIDSQIELGKDKPENANDEFLRQLTSENRPMQGQSPYVFNFKFGYDNYFTRRSAIFLFNVFGERIDVLGLNGNPDIYEQPFKRLDFVLKWGLNDTYDEQVKKIGYTVTFKAKNLLDSSRETTQQDKVVERYDPGRSYSLSFSMKY